MRFFAKTMESPTQLPLHCICKGVTLAHSGLTIGFPYLKLSVNFVSFYFVSYHCGSLICFL